MKHKTWSLAIVAGLSILIATGCGAIASLGASCGGADGASCTGPSFCFYETGCGGLGEAGVCQLIPEVCIEIFEPVCGCDGKTYGNQCKARANGVNIAAQGACEQTP